MLQHQHQNELPEVVRQSPSAGAPTAHGLDRLRAAGESLLQAADQAIARALSGDSLAFLESTRQDGGQ
jgi:hypothetical protein